SKLPGPTVAPGGWGELSRITKSHWLRVDMAGQRVDDKVMKTWCDWARSALGAAGSCKAAAIDFSSNSICDAGAIMLVDLLLELKVPVHQIWLQKNRLGRTACEAIGRLVLGLPCALRELHLSHNYIDLSGAKALLEAVASSSSGCSGQPAYPVAPEPHVRPIPLWLRLEKNPLEGQRATRPETGDWLLEEMARAIVRKRHEKGWPMGPPGQGPPLLLCSAGRQGCSVGTCIHQLRTPCPLVHIPHIGSPHSVM
ncbi:unnamed protein product, partial [Polarella glacialis]